MKKVTDIYRRLQSPELTLHKKKRKLKTEVDFTQYTHSTKLKVEIVDHVKKQTAVVYFQVQTPLKLVKVILYEKLKLLKFKTEEVIGFQTDNLDYAFDYRLQVGIGKLQKSLKLNCLHFSSGRDLEKYKICCCLAIGGFSKVFLTRSKITGGFYAAKFIDKQNKQLVNSCLLQHQRQISLKLDSPFLVKTHQFIQTAQFFVFVMDYCPGGELFYLLKQIKFMNQEQARTCFIQIMLGIEHLHACGYMYRDLKPENILLDANGHMKIADFGLAKRYFQKSYSFCGSVQYMAPEIIKGKGHEKFVDFYCLGALLYEMLVGHPPFYNSAYTVDQTKARILYDQIEFPQSLSLSKEVKDLINKLTKKNQRQRLGYFGGCKQIMAHPWIGKINRKNYEQKKFQPPFPVDLSKLNFDPEQIGQSQRIFELRINQSLSASKNLHAKQKVNCKLGKSHSQKVILKQNKSPHKNKSFLLNVFQQKELRNSKSPYQLTLNHQKSAKKLKSQKSEQKIKRSYVDNVRWTQMYGSKKKQNKMILAASKLRKKCKYVPFVTIAQNSPFKNKKSNLQNSKSIENIRSKVKLLSSEHLS